MPEQEQGASGMAHMHEPMDREPMAALSPDKRQQAVEVCVFVFLILPSMVLSFFASAQGGGSVPFLLGATAIVVRDLALLALVLFFLWRNHESVRRIGWTRRNIGREIVWGIVLFGPMFVAALIVDEAATRIGLSTPVHEGGPGALQPRGLADFVAAGVLVGVVAVVEESIFRGYLLLRLRSTLGSLAAAVIFSSIIFSIGHGYEGSAGVVTVGFMGLVMALVYVWRGSLVASVVMHFAQDFLAIVVVPLISRAAPHG